MSIIKTVEEIRRKLNIRLDADDEEQPKPKKHSALSTRLPYALCKETGINTEGMTPREAWEAYEGKTGKSAESAKSEKMGDNSGGSEESDTSKYVGAFKDAVKGHSSFEIKDAVRKSLDEMPTGYTAISHDRAYKKIGDDQFEYETSSGEKKVATVKQILKAHGRSDLEGDFDVKDDKYVHQKKQVKSDLNEKLRPSRDDYEYEDGDGVDEFTHKNVGKLMPLYEEGGSDAIDSEYYKFKLGRVTKDLHEISRDEADEILYDNLSQSTVDGWFREYNHEVKDNLTKQMIQSPEVHNAALNIMYGNYKNYCEGKNEKPLSYSEFLVTPIKMYRGGTGKEYDKASVFSSYTYDKDVAGTFTGSEVGMGHAFDPNGVVYEAEIRPIDTYGSVFSNGEAEILVPREIAPNGRRDEAD